jgi:sugar phosphate isomerase/epimerase
MHTSRAISRRDSLKTFATVAAACVIPANAAEPAGPRWKTAIGLNGFLSGVHKYKKTYPIWEVLDFASRGGFDGVELVMDWPMGGYPGAGETSRLQALKRLYDGFGLKIFSIQLGAEGAFDPDDAGRRRWLDQFRDHALFAQRIGCAHVGLWPGGGLRGQTVDQAIDRLAATFREAGKIALDLGMVASFEIEPPFVFNTEDHYQRILKGADHPGLKGIYDPSHFDLMLGGKGHPEAMLERVGVKNIGYVHFTDTDGTLRDAGTSKHVACGEGHVDIPKSLRILRDGGFRGWIMIDAWEVPDAYDACTKGKRAIDAAWKA